MIETVQKRWWVLLLRGILWLLFGIMAIATPGLILGTLLLYFGFLAILSGIFVIIEGFMSEGSKGSQILEGIFYIIVGLIFIIMPGFIVSFTMYFLAFWALIAGVFMIVTAIKLRKVIENEWFTIFNGIITIIFGILIFANVFVSAQALVMIFGFYAIISGIIMIVLSFKVKGLKK